MIVGANKKRVAFGWFFAFCGALLLNVCLFGIMPGLIQKIQAPPEQMDAMKNIQVIRVKKQDSPLRKKPLKKIEKPKPPKPLRRAAIAKTQPKQIDIRPRLKFELNTKLPTAPTDLVMPSLEHFSMEMPTLKDVYDLSELDTGLMALVKIPPVYPMRAQRRGIAGFVTVQFLVTKEGNVRDIEIIEAKPEKIFNNNVIKGVSRWKFKPPTVEGIPVNTRAEVTLNFRP